MDLKQIEVFLCVYDERSVTRAALRLNVVQPAVSMQIKKLEEAIGVRLFDRTTRGLVPTSAGTALHAIFLPIMSEFRMGRQRALELGGRTVGQVSVGLNPSLTNAFLAPVLRRYRSQLPDVEIRVDEDLSDALIDRVVLGTLDFAVITDTGRRAGLTAIELIEEEIVLIERAGPEGDDRPVRFVDLTARRLILPKFRQGYRQLFDDAAERAGAHIIPYLEINSAGPTLQLVADGELSTIMPVITARRAMLTLPLAIRRLAAPSLSRRVCCVHRERHPLSPIMEAFVAILKEQLVQAQDEAPVGV